jgi:hypothetical protein
MRIWHFCRAGAPAGVGIDVLGIAVFAGNGDRARLEACKGRRRRFRSHFCGRVVGASPIAKAHTYTHSDTHTHT